MRAYNKNKRSWENKWKEWEEGSPPGEEEGGETSFPDVTPILVTLHSQQFIKITGRIRGRGGVAMATTCFPGDPPPFPLMRSPPLSDLAALFTICLPSLNTVLHFPVPSCWIKHVALYSVADVSHVTCRGRRGAAPAADFEYETETNWVVMRTWFF